MRTYILVDGIPQPASMLEFAEWFGEADRSIANTEIGEATISTVFLGIDHNYRGRGDPILFETMVFGGSSDGEQRRYRTKEEALIGHEEMVANVKMEINNDNWACKNNGPNMVKIVNAMDGGECYKWIELLHEMWEVAYQDEITSEQKVILEKILAFEGQILLDPDMTDGPHSASPEVMLKRFAKSMLKK